MKEFLGIGGYSRTPEGFLSWQHLLFVGILLGLMLFWRFGLANAIA